ncbi:MAG: methionine synthase [Propionicimonas sp.]|uniref:methionine synthase n=1 Tax=Propionicimonas sp. TaxID=1955623 RepID=UPI002B1EE336|nr:methionine synthase [Propionicimonas sp.]MEA4943181.1 methionine synthase [Propionicimonas sp.]
MAGFTGLGSLPGVDLGVAVRMTFDKVPDFPYLPELPARGPWAGMIGRGLGVLTGLDAEYGAGEWRLGAPGADQRRARQTWRDDLEVLQEHAQGYRGRFKLQVAGPWTLAAATGVAHTGRVLADTGARRDLAGALADGIGEVLDDLHRRLPDLDLVLQVDEPSLPAVAAGAVPTPGGFFRHRAVDLPEIATNLALLTAEPARRGLEVETLVHCCAPGLPIAAMVQGGHRGAGFGGVSLDLSLVRPVDLDALAAAAESGTAIYLGCLPTADPLVVAGVDQVRRSALAFIDRLGVDGLAERLFLTPACGLAGFGEASVSRVFGVLAKATAQVNEELGESA